MDVFLYSGDLARTDDLRFMEFVASEKKHDTLLLILATAGGSPDAAYKIGRYLQKRYDNFTVLVPGFCKSAGTLLTIAASELAISPYGELGPLDIQMTKIDNVAGMDSGLNISEAFITLENRAKETFHALVGEIIQGSGGIVSFHTASHSANEIVSSLFGPIFKSIDPEEVGSRARAMRIGEDYGKRLNLKYKNLKSGALEFLSQSYPSHNFVIDLEEAGHLFKKTRPARDVEQRLIDEIGDTCRHPRDCSFENFTERYKEIFKEMESQKDEREEGSSSEEERASNGKTGGGKAGTQFNGGDSQRAG